MSHIASQLLSFPDELLLMIFKQLDNIDVLYSLMGLDKHLDAIIRDPCFTTVLTLMKSNDDIERDQNEIFLDRFCFDIIPKIHHLIEWLKLDSTTMERILQVADYPNLWQLDIFIANEDPILNFNDQSSIIDRFKNRTLILSVTGEENKNYANYRFFMKRRAKLFNHIFEIFPRLQQLKFYQTSLDANTHVYFTDQPSMFSSTLVELHVNPYSFQDFLYLIDGRFDQLRILIVKLVNPWRNKPIRINSKPISNLKEFSFTCLSGTDAYHEWLVPMFQRMINLEKLSLHIKIHCQRTFIDGNHIKEDILRHMPRLKDFIFDIRSIIPLDGGEIHLQSDEDIRSTLKDLTKHQVTSRVDYFRNEGDGHCHIHTNPMLSTEYEFVSNNFRGEIFENIQSVELFDERPFEHSFFMRIAQSFPSMKRLSVRNEIAQQERQNHQLPIIKYGSLQKLILLWVHDDYIEQFLFDTRTNLSSDLILTCVEKQLERVTNDFTREETKVNCSKVKSFNLHVERDISELISTFSD